MTKKFWGRTGWGWLFASLTAIALLLGVVGWISLTLTLILVLASLFATAVVAVKYRQ